VKLFRYDADRIPVLWFTLLFGLDLLVFFLVDSLAFVGAWMVIGMFPKACISSFGHHHQHLPTFHQPILNRCLEIVLGFQTGATSHAWFLHHVVGHHQHYKDQALDESRWQREDGRTMGAHEYSAVLFGTSYARAFTAGRRFPRLRLAFIAMALLQVALLSWLFVLNWVNALLLFLLPMAVSLYITCWHTYYHHAGLDTDDDLRASFNIEHRWYNILTGNLGYHTAHHMAGGLHWSLLPRLHGEICGRIPPECFREPSIPFTWMPGAQEVHRTERPTRISVSEKQERS